VLLNDRPLCRTLTGVGNYITQLLTHVPACDPQVRIDPFYHRWLSRRDWRERLRPPEALPAAPRHPRDLGDARPPWFLRRVLQGAYRFLFRRAAGGYEVYHEPNHIPMRCDLPTVTTIHDLSVLLHPDWHPPDRVAWYRREFDAGVRQTARFIAVSEFTRRELVEHVGVPAERIHVTYQAPREAFRPLNGDQRQRALRGLDVPERFFLYVGTLEPRKNVVTLLEAWAALPARLRQESVLLIAGAWGWRADDLRAALGRDELRGSVRLLGYLHDPQLAALYSTCTAFVWPTRYEGFGLPPLEAMACGAPVVVSDVASLPEVVGEAGLRLPPDDPAAWCAALERMACDADLRERCRERGLAQAAQFTWRRFAEETLRVYRAAMGETESTSRSAAAPLATG
jgi:glycosyltransferase involved in cell wall biosynthesis